MTDISVTISDDPVSVSVSNAPGPAGASSFFKGMAASWPPTATPTAGWIYTLPDPLPAGTPAGYQPGYGAQWDGTVWTNIGPVRGPAGPAGPQGAAGAAGSPGAAGTAATITVGAVTTGAPGTSASVINSGSSSAAVLDIVIPRGDVGPAGPAGATGATGSPGAAGPAGTAATVSIGTVTTGAAGSSATVTNVGTSSAAVLNITIPRGDTGAVGAAGAAGAAGSAGAAATVSVGTVTTGAAGSSATVTNVGTTSAAVLNFSIPQGAAGAAGATGATGSSGVVSVTAPLTNSGTSTAAVLGIDLTAPGAIGGTTPAAGTFTVLAATSRANLPSGAAGSPAARDLYAVGDTLRYRDSSNAERLVLNATDNLANLASAATARANLGLAAVASSGSASDLTTGTLAAARIGAHASTHQTGGADAVSSVVVTPTSLAADVNDWSIGTGDVFRVAGTAARNITGIVAGSSGLTILLVNVGSFALTLKHQSASSTAANRITVPWAGDCVLAASGGAAVLVYDSTSATWRVV